MAKAILEFNLADPDDKIEYDRMNKALDLCLALWDIEQYLRSKTKYAPDDMPEEVYEALDKAREEFYDIMNQRNISLDDLLK